MSKYYDEQLKKDAVEYYLSHKNLGRKGCAKNLGVGMSTLSKWDMNTDQLGPLKLVVLGITLLMKRRKLLVYKKNYVIQRMHLKY